MRTILRAYSSDGSFESLLEQDLQKEKDTVLHEIIDNLRSLLDDQTNYVFIVEREKFMIEIEEYFSNVIREFETDYEHDKFQLLD